MIIELQTQYAKVHPNKQRKIYTQCAKVHQNKRKQKYKLKALKCTEQMKFKITTCQSALKSFLNVAIKALGVPPQEYLQLRPVDFSGVFLGPVLVMTLPLSPPARVNF